MEKGYGGSGTYQRTTATGEEPVGRDCSSRLCFWRWNKYRLVGVKGKEK
jgi:hypothetical protein